MKIEEWKQNIPANPNNFAESIRQNFINKLIRRTRLLQSIFRLIFLNQFYRLTANGKMTAGWVQYMFYRIYNLGYLTFLAHFLKNIWSF